MCLQASQLYPLDEGTPLQVFSHQLWAACALFQATGDEEYWQDTLAIYARYFDAVKPVDGSPLFNPSANYRNPQWYALLCMAQSSPDASKIADDPLIAVPEHVDPSAESEANETAAGWAAGQRADYRRYLRAQLPATGTRMEVMRQLSNNFVNPWLTLQSQAAGEPGDDPVFEQNVRLRCGPSGLDAGCACMTAQRSRRAAALCCGQRFCWYPATSSCMCVHACVSLSVLQSPVYPPRCRHVAQALGPDMTQAGPPLLPAHAGASSLLRNRSVCHGRRRAMPLQCVLPG